MLLAVAQGLWLYRLYVVAHEAVHKKLFPRSPWLNELAGIFMLVVSGGPKLGDLEAGLVASAFSPTISVISGGIACMVGAVIVAARYPELRRYRAELPTAE